MPADDIIAAARMFAEAPKAHAGTGTGPSMSPHPSLMEHLVQCLNVVTGRFLREGEVGESMSLLQPTAPRRAQVLGPFDPLTGPESRFRNLRGYGGEMPCTTLAQEITEPGDGQVKALISNGGNPVAAWPDQTRSLEAMEALELLVVIDHRMTQTAVFADYVIPPRLSLERADVPPFMDRWFREPYACYTPAVVEPEGDLFNDWEVYWEIAERLGVEMTLPGGTDSQRRSPPERRRRLRSHLCQGPGAVRRRTCQERPGAAPSSSRRSSPPTDTAGRFHIGLADHMAELAQVHTEATSGERMAGFDPAVHTFRLISRRLKTHLNSLGGELPGLNRKNPTNYAYMNPDDMADLGIADEDLIEVASPRAVAHRRGQGSDRPAARRRVDGALVGGGRAHRRKGPRHRRAHQPADRRRERLRPHHRPGHPERNPGVGHPRDRRGPDPGLSRTPAFTVRTERGADCPGRRTRRPTARRRLHGQGSTVWVPEKATGTPAAS